MYQGHGHGNLHDERILTADQHPAHFFQEVNMAMTGSLDDVEDADPCMEHMEHMHQDSCSVRIVRISISIAV